MKAKYSLFLFLILLPWPLSAFGEQSTEVDYDALAECIWLNEPRLAASVVSAENTEHALLAFIFHGSPRDECNLKGVELAPFSEAIRDAGETTERRAYTASKLKFEQATAALPKPVRKKRDPYLVTDADMAFAGCLENKARYKVVRFLKTDAGTEGERSALRELSEHSLDCSPVSNGVYRVHPVTLRLALDEVERARSQDGSG